MAGGKGYYTAVNIRAHIMNNQEYYFYKIGENGKLMDSLLLFLMLAIIRLSILQH